MKKYETLTIKVVTFSYEDVLTASVIGDDYLRDIFPEKAFLE